MKEEISPYQLKYIVLPDFIYKMDLNGTELRVAGFIYSFRGDKFYFSNSQLAKMFNCSPVSIKRAVLSLKNRGLIDLEYKIKSGGGKIRFIKIKQNDQSEWSKMTSQNGQKIPVYINDNKINDNKINNNTIVEDFQPSTTSSLKEEENIIKTSEVPNLRGSQYQPLSNEDNSSLKEENKETSQFQETANSEKEKNSSAVRDVFSYFYKKCKDEMGFYPVINYAKEGKLIKTKLPLLEKNHTTYQKLIDFYFESPEVEKLGPTLSTIFSSFFVNKFLKEFGFTDEEYKKRQELKEKFKRSNK